MKATTSLTRYPATTKLMQDPAYTTSVRRALFDTREINSNVSVATFFPGTDDGGPEASNYEENPFPGNRRRIIHEIGFELSAQVLTFASAAAAAAFINNLQNAYVELWVGDSRCDYQSIMLVDLLAVEIILDTQLDGEEAQVTVHLKPTAVPAYIDPVFLNVNERFYMRVTFPNNGGLPAPATNIDGTPGQNLHLRAKLGLAEWDSAQQESHERAVRQVGSMTVANPAVRPAPVNGQRQVA